MCVSCGSDAGIVATRARSGGGAQRQGEVSSPGYLAASASTVASFQ
jgi:hypothetical protein